MRKRDAEYGRNPDEVVKTKNFYLPIGKYRTGEFKVPDGATFFTCFTSDFFIEEADEWRIEAWDMINQRCDCYFVIFTKRIERFTVNLPFNWGEGFKNVTIGVSCENQKMADERLSVLSTLPIQSKIIALAPLLEKVTISEYLSQSSLEYVIVDGESGRNARTLNYDWVLSVRKQCLQNGVPFMFGQTGARFVKDGRLYHVKRRMQRSQAAKADINSIPVKY
jgi:protein gp37